MRAVTTHGAGMTLFAFTPLQLAQYSDTTGVGPALGEPDLTRFVTSVASVVFSLFCRSLRSPPHAPQSSHRWLVPRVSLRRGGYHPTPVDGLECAQPQEGQNHAISARLAAPLA